LRYAVERFRLHLELRSLSLTDELTNLNNRRGFFTLAEQMRKQAVRQRQRLVLFYADLDGLKGINDRFGHSEGDLVIAEAGRLLNATFRESDLVCRIGGDEFVVLTIEDENGIIENAIGRIADRIAEWNRLRDTGPKLSMSVGVSCFEPQDRRSLEAALTSADAELYRQKRLKSRQQPPRDQASALAPMGESI
jgi:diguanylate cyclase (GGDEF)-like protein